MKFLSIVFTLFFVAFLAAPTVVGMIDNETDTSYFFNVSEEEENHTTYSLIESVQTSNVSIFNFFIDKLLKVDILIDVDMNFDNLAHQIFSPPPNSL